MHFNVWIYLLNNWQNLLFVAFILIPVIPPSWLGVNPTYFNTYYKKDIPNPRYSLLRALVHILFSIPAEFVLQLSTFFVLKATVTIVIFSVVGVDLYFNRSLSSQSVELTAIGILALYLEQLIEKAKKISVWKFFEWESKEQKTETPDT